MQRHVTQDPSVPYRYVGGGNVQVVSGTTGRLNVVQQWKNENPDFPDEYARFFIVGCSNTGKTTLCCRIVKTRLAHQPRSQLVIISPNWERDQKLQELTEYAQQMGLNVRVYPSFTKRSIAKFVQYMGRCASEQIKTIVYLDDPVGLGQFTSNVNRESPFNSFVTGCKHYLCDILFSTQAVGAMSRSARKNIDVFIFLPDMISRKELYLACPFVSSQYDFDRMMDKYASRAYHALWINVQGGRRGVYCINQNGDISPISSVPL